MSELKDLQAEREYTKHVQQLLLSVIDQSAKISDSHSEAIRMMIAHAAHGAVHPGIGAIVHGNGSF